MIAVAAFGLVACTSSQKSSDTPGTTPPVWTGSAAPSASSETEGTANSGPSAKAELKDPSGKEVGTVTFTEDAGHLVVTVEAQGLTPGFHGFHVHQVGKCEADSVAPAGGAPGDFLSAGGHYQVGGRTGHPASGDLTSIEVLADGTARLVTNTDAFTLDDLKADGGHAVIIHADADNFANIPTRYTLPDGAPVPDEQTLTTGDAGGRVACGVVK